MRVARLLALALIAALALAAPASAQVTAGTIVGTVTDSGGVVPGATVTLRNVNRGTTTTFVTDECRRLHGARSWCPAPMPSKSRCRASRNGCAATSCWK